MDTECAISNEKYLHLRSGPYAFSDIKNSAESLASKNIAIKSVINKQVEADSFNSSSQHMNDDMQREMNKRLDN